MDKEVVKSIFCLSGQKYISTVGEEILENVKKTIKFGFVDFFIAVKWMDESTST